MVPLRQSEAIGYPAAVIERPNDLRTGDTLVYELLRSTGPSGPTVVIGRATFRDGRSEVEAPDGVAIAVQELLESGFVDRVHASERPRGYRRTTGGRVEMLVPGMAEHFVARLRGLWLPYPDRTVVTARPTGHTPERRSASQAPDVAEASAPVADPTVRRATLTESDEILSTRPLVRGNEPESGVRPAAERAVARTDCGWIC
jgi:hypothetical protein